MQTRVRRRLVLASWALGLDGRGFPAGGPGLTRDRKLHTRRSGTGVPGDVNALAGSGEYEARLRHDPSMAW
jgi:hypothetical protein